MARGRRNTTDETKRQCFILYDDLQSYSEVGRRLNLAPNTVKSIVNNRELIAKFNPLLQEIANIKEESNETLLEMLNGTQYSNITKNAMNLLTTENMEKEINTRGIRALITITGISYDKAMAYKRLMIDERKLDIAERTLQLKEQELQARIDNPEAFNNIVIVKDTDEAYTQYQEEMNENYVRD